MEYADLIVTRGDRVATVMLNRPDKGNALRMQTFKELERAFGELEADSGVRVIVLGASGEKFFSTGIDLEADGLPDTSESWDEHTRRNTAVLSRIWRLDKPVITAVNGYALAAGCNLALIGDITIAASNASLGEPEIRHGALSPLLLLPWLTHFKAFSEMYLTGDPVGAGRALELGLINRVVGPGELAEVAQRTARRIANAPAYALAMAKRAIRLSLDVQGFSVAQTAHRYIDTFLLDSRGVTEKEALMDTLARQGMRAFLDARDGPYGAGGS